MVDSETRRIHARQPPALKGVPPRYQVFDRRKSPPMSIGQFYYDPELDAVVFEVYGDQFREFLKRDRALVGKRFEWVIDVDADAPHDPRVAIMRPYPMPDPSDRGDDAAPALSLDEALAATRAIADFRVIQTSDPL